MSEQDRVGRSKTAFEERRPERSGRRRFNEPERLSAHPARRMPRSEGAPQADIVHDPRASASGSRAPNEILLHGCTPTPLACYLKALAVFRLVSEQGGDPDAAGCWRNDTFVLRTTLTKRDLNSFFLHRYEPTPLVAPWNGGSGFYPRDNRIALEKLRASRHPRFRSYREAISLCAEELQRRDLAESPKDAEKRALLEALRAVAPDGMLRWMDVAAILSDGELQYPPLLGTGGNDGRLDFTNNFMQRLVELFDAGDGSPRDDCAQLLEASLFGGHTSELSTSAIGQFAPGHAGGPNATSGFEADSLINPWDFVLMLEGAVLFAASVVRRLESSSAAMLSAPFTVRTRAATVGSAASEDDTDARGEIWLPLWEGMATLAELQTLLSEGRVTLGRRQARDGLDFARAVARLGADRGVSAFQRFGFLKRSGKAFLATPMSRVAVRRNPQADLIDELDSGNWLGDVQRLARDEKSPNAFRALSARLDAALYELAQRQDRAAVQRALCLAGRVEALCGINPKLQEQLPPLPALSAAWASRANDASPEFRIAAALAGLRLRGEKGGKPVWLGLRPHLAAVEPDRRGWDKDGGLVCWGPGPIERNLAALLHRRRLAATSLGAEGEMLASQAGATLEDVQRFLEGETDDRRIAELVHGLACVKGLDRLEAAHSPERFAPFPVYALLKPFFTSEKMLRTLGWLPADRTLRLPAEVPARLAADDLSLALRIAWRQLRILGVELPGREPPEAPRLGLGPRLLAALVIPVGFAETGRLLRSLSLEPERESDTSTSSLSISA